MMYQSFCYIAFMDDGKAIAWGFIPTKILLWVLPALFLDYCHLDDYFHYSVSIFIPIVIFLTIGIIMIKKEKYTNIGVGITAAVIAYWLCVVMVYIALSGPM